MNEPFHREVMFVLGYWFVFLICSFTVALLQEVSRGTFVKTCVKLWFDVPEYT